MPQFKFLSLFCRHKPAASQRERVEPDRVEPPRVDPPTIWSLITTPQTRVSRPREPPVGVQAANGKTNTIPHPKRPHQDSYWKAYMTIRSRRDSGNVTLLPVEIDGLKCVEVRTEEPDAVRSGIASRGQDPTRIHDWKREEICKQIMDIDPGFTKSARRGGFVMDVPKWAPGRKATLLIRFYGVTEQDFERPMENARAIAQI
ncbi:hypothetical protein B0H66DRAFT_537511 [Apodospora peruviana]|uniref:Uncharacterized protein n=1 Tax=Apodospora peruviana TaxID=516989 RepID=A0AAE0M030_9PEZI|nr:hypothetical protein B0H66DRAFT_537511 [Apodospora peruviana]